MSLVSDLLPTVDELRGLAGTLGTRYYTVETVKRTWAGTEPGDGAPTEVATTIVPTPKVKTFSQDQRILPGGPIEQGDILLTGVSKVTYARADINGGSLAANEEFFWRVDGKLYRVVNVNEDLTDWKVLIRRTIENG